MGSSKGELVLGLSARVIRVGARMLWESASDLGERGTTIGRCCGWC